jgi:F-type H+-transporting ATPase subunit epsilon
MNGKKLHLEILTPEKKVVDERVDYVSAPGTEGEFGVLPGHVDFVSLLFPGEVSFDAGTGKTYYAVSQGYAYVDESTVSILVENAEKGEDIDVERAMKDKEKLEQDIAGLEPDDKNQDKIRMKIERAQARLNVAARFAEKK